MSVSDQRSLTDAVRALINWVSRNRGATKLQHRVLELINAGRTVSEVANKFGVPDAVVRHWVREADLEDVPAHVGSTGDAQSEKGAENVTSEEGPTFLL